MTRTTTIGLVAIAFVAGSILTASLASAAPPNGLDNLGQRIKALEDIIQIDPDTKNVHIKSQSGLSLEAGEGNEISVNTKASFQEDTEMRKKAKVMGETELEGDMMAMGTTTVEGELTAESEATIGEKLKIRAVDGPEGEFYVTVNDIVVPIGGLPSQGPGIPAGLVSASCNDGDVAVGGGVQSVPDWDFKTSGGFKDDAEPEDFVVRMASGNPEELDVTIMALCISLGG